MFFRSRPKDATRALTIERCGNNFFGQAHTDALLLRSQRRREVQLNFTFEHTAENVRQPALGCPKNFEEAELHAICTLLELNGCNESHAGAV
jgi:hypothetical protein